MAIEEGPNTLGLKYISFNLASVLALMCAATQCHLGFLTPRLPASPWALPCGGWFFEVPDVARDIQYRSWPFRLHRSPARTCPGPLLFLYEH